MCSFLQVLLNGLVIENTLANQDDTKHFVYGFQQSKSSTKTNSLITWQKISGDAQSLYGFIY